MLILNNIEVVYRQVILVLKGISLEVPQGGVVSLIGANGSGKSTVLRAISGLLVPLEGRITQGGITYEGRRIDPLAAEDIVRLGIVQVMQGRKVFEHLTVQENLLLGAHVRRDKAGVKGDLDLVYSAMPLLRGLSSRVSGYLSGGEQQMLVMARALMARPRLLLLDEPLLGLSQAMTEDVFRIIRAMNVEQGVSILLVEQNALGALELSDYGYILENGRVVADGPARELMENPEVKEFYLGLGHRENRTSYREVKHYRRRRRWLV